MIVQEPVQAAIWHCLNHYDYQDAVFLAEKLFAEIESDDSIFLLATCYYRAGQIHQALWLLQNKGASTPECKYLMAKCAYELKLYADAETALSNDIITKVKNLEEISKNFGEVACFALQLIAKICLQTERNSLATEANKIALKLNPFLWHSFVDLCNRGEKVDPTSIFQFPNTDIFATCQGNNMNSVLLQGNTSDTNIDLNDSHNYNNYNIYTTPSDQISQCIVQNNITPNNNLNNSMSALRGVAIHDTPLTKNINNINTETQNLDDGTPFRKQFKYLSHISPSTPSFGILPMASPNDNSFNYISSAQTLVEVNDQKTLGKKFKGHVGSLINRNKETPLQQSKPIIFSQTGNITPRTPNALSGQNVRRSSRLFSNVKENNKSPNINKFAAPKSPPRKAKQRISKINLNNSTLNDLNEKQKSDKNKIETITSTDNKVLLNNSINNAQNMAQHFLTLKKQSAEGLMSLLRELGQGYYHLARYECKEAISYFSNVPLQHYNSNWVQSMIALAYYEQRDYEPAVKIFKEIHDNEPNRLHLMEIYSTALWHLQKEVTLSALAQDLMAQDKNSAITWCVAGNCFSLHKEHETAIKFFQRAVQVDPNYAYSYTLLGHELVMTEELEKALACFRTSILKDSRHYNAWFGIATIFSKQERYHLAEIHYRRALQLNPKNSIILVHIGAVQFFLKKTEQALQTLNAAINIDPKNPLCKFHRGSMYFSMGKNQEALKELEELKQIVPKESIVYYLIGKIHKKLGNVDLALMHFSWATDLDPKGANNHIKDAFDSFDMSQNTNINLTVEQDVEPSSERSDDSTQVRNRDIDVFGNDYESDSY